MRINRDAGPDPRLRAARRGRLLMLGLLALLLVVVWVRRRAERAAFEALAPGAAGTLAQPGDGAGALVVEAAGMVARPGTYRLDPLGRLGDLLDAAGAYAPSGEALPQQWRGLTLRQGARVEIGWSTSDGAQLQISMMSAADRLLFGILLDINEATADDLTAIQGIGPGTAAAIVSERDRRGGFKTLEEVGAVKGVGEGTLEALRTTVVIGPASPPGLAPVAPGPVVGE